MPVIQPPNNECSEQNESIGNVSESEEDNIDNNPIEDNIQIQVSLNQTHNNGSLVPKVHLFRKNNVQ